MAQNTLAPHWVVLEYLVDSEPHSMSFSVSVSNDTLGLTSYDLVKRDGISVVDFSQYMTTFVNVLKLHLNQTDGSFSNATLYRQLSTDAVPVILEVALVAVAGTGVGATVKASQISWNFYGQQRSRLRLTLLDGTVPPFARQSYVDLNPTGQAVIDHVLSADCPIQTRAGEYIKTFGQRTTTYNDKLTQKYFNVK